MFKSISEQKERITVAEPYDSANKICSDVMHLSNKEKKNFKNSVTVLTRLYRVLLAFIV